MNFSLFWFVFLPIKCHYFCLQLSFSFFLILWSNFSHKQSGLKKILSCDLPPWCVFLIHVHSSYNLLFIWVEWSALMLLGFKVALALCKDWMLLPGSINEQTLLLLYLIVRGKLLPLHILTELPSTTIDSLLLYKTTSFCFQPFLYSGYQDIVSTWLAAFLCPDINQKFDCITLTQFCSL